MDHNYTIFKPYTSLIGDNSNAIIKNDTDPQSSELQTISNSTNTAYFQGRAVAVRSDAPENPVKVLPVHKEVSKEKIEARKIAWIKAAVSGHVYKIESLLKKGFDGINSVTNSNGLSALHLAASEGFVPIVQLLLDYGADAEVKTNQACNAIRPLHYAVLNKRIAVIKLLLDRGADINARGLLNINPLNLAAGVDDTGDIIELLLSRGAKKDINSRFLTTQETPLHVAVQAGHVNAAKFLLDYGADTESPDKNGRTALYYAAGAGRLKIVDMLINYNSNVNNKDFKGQAVLHAAANEGHAEVVKSLLENKANIHDVISTGETALHLAACEGHISVIQILLERNADVNCEDKMGWTALHWTAREGHAEAAELLLQHGASINAKGKMSETPLHLAAFHSKLEVVKLLLAKGADSGAQAKYGITPIQLACLNRSLQAAFLLFRNYFGI
jgi:ankyrin repeat protein